MMVKRKNGAEFCLRFLVMVTVISLLLGCAGSVQKKKMQKTITVCIYGAQTRMKICTIHPETTPGYPG